MAIGALIPLILGGGYALKNQQRKRDEQDRQGLAGQFQQAIGAAATPGQQATLFNDQNQNIGQLSGVGATQGSGILGTVNDPRLQEQIRQASNIFGTKGGEQMGQSMLQTALASQQQNLGQENLFNEQQDSQQRGFAQSNIEQRARLDNSNDQAQARLDQSDQQFTAQQAEAQRVRVEERQLAANAFAKQHSIQGAPASGYWRVQDPTGKPGEYLDIPDAANPLRLEAQGKISGLATGVQRMDELIELFDDIGTNAFGTKGGDLDSKYGAAVTAMKNVLELGVLSDADIGLVEQVIKNPNGFGAAFTADDTIKASYKNALAMLQGNLKIQNQKYSIWGEGSQFADTTPSQLKALAEEKKKRDEAEAQGITLGPAPRTEQQAQRRPGRYGSSN
jgi:hypothetical protein